MLTERGVNVEYTTIHRRVQRYAPEMEKRLRWYWINPSWFGLWHLDEGYINVNGQWAYLPRAVDSKGAPSIFISLLTVSAKRHIGF